MLPDQLQIFFMPRIASNLRVLSAALLLLFPLLVTAQDVEGIVPYPQATTKRMDTKINTDYTLALSKVRKVNGFWQLEKQRRLLGDLHSVTYELAKSVSADEAYEHFATQLQALASPLFQCKARACGSSNQWANFVFNEKRLYGPETEQRYLAAKNADSFFALYVIKRGNKRVYVRLDRLQAKGDAASDANAIKRFSFARYPLQRNEQLSPLARRWLLKNLNTLRESNQFIWVVAHRNAQAGSGVEQLLKQAQQDAQFLKRMLIERGIAAERIETFAVGPLAPLEGANGKGRIELLLLNP